MFYIAIIADVVDSTNKMKDNIKVKEVVSKFSEEFRKYTATDFDIKKKDELQGLVEYNNVHVLLKLLRYIKGELYPLKLRIGLGIGTVEEDSISNNPFDVSGSAFIAARKALNVTDTKKNKTINYDTYLELADEVNLDDLLALNVLLKLLDEYTKSWNEETFFISKMIDNDMIQKDIAKLLITKYEKNSKIETERSSLARKIINKNIYEVKGIEEAILDIFMKGDLQ